MIRYPKDYNPILEYWNKIESGEEIVSDKIYRTYKKVIYDLTDNTSEFYYSNARGNHVIEFIENYCRHSKGAFGGKPVILELWEKAMLATIFGFIDISGNRKYREAMLIIGKKNGKSLLASCVGLYLLIGDGEAGAEVYAVSTKKDQSKIIWLEAKRMVKKSPALRKRIKPLVAELSSEDFNDGVFKPLSSDVDTLDGMNIHGGLMDELQQWKNGKALYDIIADGVTAREQPLIFITTTAGVIREDIYDEKYADAERLINGYFDTNGYVDERTICFIYELDKREEWKDPKCWKKANPALGTVKNLKTLTDKINKAKQNPKLVKNLLCKEFNIRETSSEAWLTFEQIYNPSKFKLDKENKKLILEEYNFETKQYQIIEKSYPRYAIGGADLSRTLDLTASKIIFMLPNDNRIYVMQMYWMPEDVFNERTMDGTCKIRYDIWKDEGYLRLCEGNSINYKDITSWFKEIQDTFDIYIYNVGYDAWSAKYWICEMEETFGKEIMTPVRQGKQTLSLPMQQLGADLSKKKIIYNDNPIDKWCLCNTAVDVDKNDNIQPIKTSDRNLRIDGTASLLDAYVALQDKYEDYLNII